MRPLEIAGAAAGIRLSDLLELEPVEVDLFRPVTLCDDPEGLYGGQVLAQALRAASLTVGDGFVAHSLHGYFVRQGDPRRSLLLRVSRDRDGRSYAARRVLAVQDGAVLLNVLASFHRGEDGPDVQGPVAPRVSRPEELVGHEISTRALGVVFRDAQPAPVVPTPERFWARVADDVPASDPNLWACMVTYVSDMCTGVFTLADFDWNVSLTSIDHSLWFHRLTAPQWLLLDLHGESVAHGRAMYRGHVFDESGVLVAGLAQESLYRRRSGPRPWTIRRSTDR